MGTDFARGMVHDDIWIMNMQTRIDLNAKVGYNTVIDDVRFPNERKVCDYLVHINRPGCEPKYINSEGGKVVHPSDEYAEVLESEADYVVSNGSYMENLYNRISVVMKEIERKSW